MKEDICPGCGYHETHFRQWAHTGDHVVTIIGFWPVEEKGLVGYDNRWISRCHYRTACAHAHWNLQIIEKPEQAQIPANIPVISVEEPYAIAERDTRGTVEPGSDIIELQKFRHPKSATYILGNTFYQRPSDYYPVDFKVGMTMSDLEIAKFSPLYGNQMTSIIWYDRVLKGVS